MLDVFKFLSKMWYLTYVYLLIILCIKSYWLCLIINIWIYDMHIHHLIIVTDNFELQLCCMYLVMTITTIENNLNLPINLKVSCKGGLGRDRMKNLPSAHHFPQDHNGQIWVNPKSGAKNLELLGLPMSVQGHKDMIDPPLFTQSISTDLKG